MILTQLSFPVWSSYLNNLIWNNFYFGAFLWCSWLMTIIFILWKPQLMFNSEPLAGFTESLSSFFFPKSQKEHESSMSNGLNWLFTSNLLGGLREITEPCICPYNCKFIFWKDELQARYFVCPCNRTDSHFFFSLSFISLYKNRNKAEFFLWICLRHCGLWFQGQVRKPANSNFKVSF